MTENYNCEAQLLMLQMQVEQLQSEIEHEIEGHKKANKRAADAERRSKRLKEEKVIMEEALATAAYCWGCPSIGQTKKCDKCGNNTVFVNVDGQFAWHGLPKRSKHD